MSRLTIFPVVCAFTVTASAQLPPQALVIQHGTLTGLPGETVEAVGHLTTNGVGGWACEIQVTNGTTSRQAIYGSPDGSPSMMLRTHAQGLAGYDQAPIPNAPQVDIGWLGVDDQGRLAYACNVRPAGTTQNFVRSVWLDDAPVAIEPPNGIPVIGALMTRDGRPCWYDGGSKLRIGTQATVLLDTLQVPNLPVGAAWIHFRHVEIAPSGAHFIVGVAPLGTAYPTRLILDGQLATAGGAVVETGLPVPSAAGGLPGETWARLDEIAVNDRGDWAFGGLLSGASGGTRSFIAVNGMVRYRSGDSIDGWVLATHSSPNAWVSLDEQGVLAMAARVQAPGMVPPTTLFYDGRAVAAAGDVVDLDGDGVAEPFATIALIASNSGSHLRIGADRAIYAMASVDTAGTPSFADNHVAVVRIPLPPIEYGEAKVNSLGLRPRLHANGAPALAANNFALQVDDLVPAKSGQAFFGSVRGNAPFFGGTLLAGGALTRLPTVMSDGAGSATIAVPIAPAMVGSTRRYQFWQRDPAHPDGTGRGITNGLEVSFFP